MEIHNGYTKQADWVAFGVLYRTPELAQTQLLSTAEKLTSPWRVFLISVVQIPRRMLHTFYLNSQTNVTKILHREVISDIILAALLVILLFL